MKLWTSFLMTHWKWSTIHFSGSGDSSAEARSCSMISSCALFCLFRDACLFTSFKESWPLLSSLLLWKWLISRLVEGVNTRQRLSFSFPELSYSLLEFKYSRKFCQHYWRFARDGIKFKAVRKNFLSDAFVAVTNGGYDMNAPRSKTFALELSLYNLDGYWVFFRTCSFHRQTEKMFISL